METSEVREYLRRCSYHKGWDLDVYESWNARAGVTVTMHVRSTYHPEQPVMAIPFSQTVPTWVNTQGEFYDWLLGMLLWLEEHESQEWFKVDGRPWVDPHSSPVHIYDDHQMTARAVKLGGDGFYTGRDPYSHMPPVESRYERVGDERVRGRVRFGESA